MRGERGRDIATEFFDKEEPDSTAFEITIAALIATALLSFPINDLNYVSYFLAFLLLTITLIRRISVASPFANKDIIDNWSTPLMEVATTFSLISIFVYVTSVIVAVIDLPPLLVFIVSGFVFVIGISLIHEFLFRDYLIWWYAKFNQKAERGDPPQGLWKTISMVSYHFSLARRDKDGFRKIPSDIKPGLDEFELDFSKWLDSMKAATLFLMIVLSLPTILAIHQFGFLGVFLPPVTVFLHDHSCFWYIAYGSSSYEDFRKPWWAVILWSTGYTLFAILVLNPPGILTIM